MMLPAHSCLTRLRLFSCTPQARDFSNPYTAQDASGASDASGPRTWARARRSMETLFLFFLSYKKQCEAYEAYEALLRKQGLMKKKPEAQPEASLSKPEASGLAIDDLPDIAVTQSEFARRVDVSRQTISKAIKAGRLELNGDRRLDLKANLRRWHETKAHTRPDRETSTTEEGEELSADSSDTDARSFWRAEILKTENRTLELEMELREHSRYHRDQAEQAVASVGGALRGGVERLIDQLAPRLVAADSAERPALLEREIAQLKQEIKKQFSRAQRKLNAN